MTSKPPGHRPAHVLLAAALLIATGEGSIRWAVTRGLVRTTTPGTEEAVLETQARTLQTRPDADLIILGDSVARVGIEASIVEAELGYRTANLALSRSFGVFGDRVMLESYLESHRPPEAILVVHALEVWTRRTSPRFIGLATPFSRGPGRALSRIRNGPLDPGQVGPSPIRAGILDPLDRLGAGLTVLTTFLPSVRYRAGIRMTLGLDSIHDLPRSTWTRDLAALSFPIRLSADARHDLIALTRLARARGIQLIVAPPPMHENARSSDLGSRAQAELLEELSREVESLPGLNLLPTDPGIPPDQSSGDLHHVNAAGVRPLTFTYARALARTRGPGPLLRDEIPGPTTPLGGTRPIR